MKIRTFVIGCFFILFGIKSGLAQAELLLMQQKLQEQGLTLEEATKKAKELEEQGLTTEQLRKYAENAKDVDVNIPQEIIVEEIQRQAEKTGIDVSQTEKLAEKAVENVELEKEKTQLKEPEKLSYFGYEIFKDIPDAFKPSSVGPVDEGYIVGPGDQLILTLWGATRLRSVMDVDPEGRILLENVGLVMVAGQRLKDLREQLKNSLAQAHAGLKPEPPRKPYPSIMMDLTVSRMRPIQIYVLGEVNKPGGYKVSNNSVPFNAIYSVGGPKTTGSLRKIQVIRNGKKQVDTVDFYDDLLKGYNPHDIRLCDNDRIFIPFRGKTVAISGKVKHPAIYELLDHENLIDLLEYCGGLTADAYTKRLQIERIIPPGERKDPSIARKIIDLDMKEIFSGKNIPLVDGDEIRIFSILDPLQNAVSIQGAVNQPGRYEISDSVRTIKDLIIQADSLTGNAYLDKAELVRINEDSTEQLISLNLREVLAGVPTENILLLRKDNLYVYSLQELEAKQKVNIEGNVRNPGAYPLRDSMMVYDLLFKGGGLTDEEFLKEVYLERADLFRKTPDGKDEYVIPFHLGKALNKEGFADTLLRPKDRIQIYSNFVDETTIEKFVFISGAIKDPGRFILQENMTLEDLMIRAGGFAEGADMTKAEISRIVSENDEETGSGQKSLNFVVRLKKEENLPISFVMDDTLRFSRETQTFLLNHRDRVYIRMDPDYQLQETVEIRGEVYYPGEYALTEENETLSEVILRAGGIKPTAYPKGGRLLRENNRVITKFDKAIEGVKRADVVLLSGDSILIPQIPNTVEVRGDISNEGLLKYEKRRRTSYYIKQAGGTEERVKNIYLTQANGATYSLKRGLLPNKNPKVDDGAVISIVQKSPREKTEFDLGKTITDVASVTSTILLLAYLVNLISK